VRKISCRVAEARVSDAPPRGGPIPNYTTPQLPINSQLPTPNSTNPNSTTPNSTNPKRLGSLGVLGVASWELLGNCGVVELWS